MAFAVSSSKSSPMSNASQKEETSATVNSIPGHYSLALYNKEDSFIESLPSLYQTKKEDEDTEEDTEDDDDDLSKGLKSTPSPEPVTCTFAFNKKKPLLLPPSIQTYSPQLNFSLYSPSPSVASSIRSSGKKSRNINHKYSLSTVSAASTLANNINSCSVTPAAVQTPTLNNKNRRTPLYSTPSSSSCYSTYKMDIRSPPQPTQSTSRFLNAFQRLRYGNHTRHHLQNVTNNSVAPADITLKPSPSKSSLADKIKSKFQKKSAGKKKFSMPRSASLSSITQWSRRGSHKSTEKSLSNKVLTHSTSTTSFMSQKITTSCSSTSSSSSSAVSSDSPATSAFSLTKSISSHRLYTHKSNLENNRYRVRQPLRAVNPNDSMRQLSINSKTRSSGVRFIKFVSVRETFSKTEYDRGSDPDAVCTRLTPAMAQEIKEELNAYKLHEMQVHEFSRVHTHFFL